MNKRFLKYIKEKRELVKVISVLALGVVLIFLGTRMQKAEPVSEGDVEQRISDACSKIEGVGECAVYVYYSPGGERDSTDTVESVIVICEGADSVDVRLRLTRMLSSFFGIGSNRVKIEKMKG